MYFSFLPLQSTVKNPGPCKQHERKTLKGGGKYADWPGNLGQKNNTVLSSLGVLFPHVLQSEYWKSPPAIWKPPWV